MSASKLRQSHHAILAANEVLFVEVELCSLHWNGPIRRQEPPGEEGEVRGAAHEDLRENFPSPSGVT